MTHMTFALLLTVLSSLAILPGIYYAYRTAKRVGTSSLLPYLLLFVFLTLFAYETAEIVEFLGDLYGMEPLAAFAETFGHIMPIAASAMLMYFAFLAGKKQ